MLCLHLHIEVVNNYKEHDKSQKNPFFSISKFMTAHFQSVLLSYSRDGKGGATIGKRLMGIKVVKGTSVAHIPATDQVVVKPGTDIGFWR